MKLIREFKCAMTGTDCVIILNAFNQEIAYSKAEYLEIKSNADHDQRTLWSETN